MRHQKENPSRLDAGSGLYRCAGTAQFNYTSSMTRATRYQRLAPYARSVFDLLREGKTPNVYLFAGSDAWNQAEHRRQTHGEGSTLVSPPIDDPETFRWPALDALVLIPGDAEGETVRRLVIALLIAGCRVIVEARPDQAPVCHYADERDALEVAA